MVTRPGGVRVDVVLLTALDFEYAAVRAHLTNLHAHTDANGTRYEIGETRHGRCRVALGLAGQGTLAANAVVTRAVTWFHPKALIFAGVAGGLHPDVALGDVVVATRVHDYQSGKAASTGFEPRGTGWPLAHGLEQEARDLARAGAWTRLLPHDTTAPPVHFKPIVSGDVVFDAKQGHHPELVADRYSDAVAVDMEAVGVAAAAHHNRFLDAITVRAVSDRADGTKRHSDATGWQPRAMTHAAAFAVALAERIAAGPGRTPPVGACPYRGLDAFTEDDAELFFGRAETADELAATASSQRFVAVVGRSGSGKSSLVRAGLVPRMRRRGWAVAVFRALPGVPAADMLAGGLLPLLRPDLGFTEALPHRRMLADALADGRLVEVVGEVLRATGANRLLVCVDQFEELVAWSADVARDLAGLLTRLSTGPAPVHVVLTVRAETLDVAVHRLGLGEVTRNSVFLLTPMTAEQLRDAIEEPVRSTGVSFDDGLVTRILEAARDAPGALTLTQFALTRLWDEQDHGRLTHHAYEGFGGVTGALASYAERVWAEELDEVQRDQARRLLLQLVRPEGDGVVRRTARGGELAPELIPLAQWLATTRLLVTGTDASGEITVDLAHAALATHWRRLRDWLAEDRDFRAWQEDLRESRRRGEPLRGVRLTTALRWLRARPHGLAAPERDFVLASRRRQRRRTSAWRGLLVIVVVLLAVASTLAVSLRVRGDQLADQLRTSATRVTVNEARERLSTDPDTAALMSVAAYRSSRDPEVLANLAGEYLRYRDVERLVDPGVGQVSEIVTSADGGVVAVAGDRSVALLRMAGEPAVVARHRATAAPRVAVSPDGRLLATAGVTGRVEVWLDGEPSLLRESGPGGRPFALRFDGAGGRLLSASGAGLTVWDVPSREEVPVPAGAVEQARTRPDAVWFGPGGDSVVVETSKDGLWLWPLDGRPPRRVTPLPPNGFALVTGDGRTAVTCADQTLEHWDLAGGKRASSRVLTQPACPPRFETAADHTGRHLVLGSPTEGESHPRDAMWLLDTAEDVPARVALPTAAADLNAPHPVIASTVAGPRLMGVIGSTVVAADLTRPDFTRLDGWHGSGPVFSPDLRRAATKVNVPGGDLHLWDTATGAEVARLPNDADLTPVRFTADGAYLLAKDKNYRAVTVLEVPTLRVVHEVPLPPEMAGNTTTYQLPKDLLCLTDLPASGEFAVVRGGLAARLDVRAGTLSEPFPLFHDENAVTRLTVSFGCGGRPGRAEFAIDTSSGVEVWHLDRRERTVTLPTTIPMITSLRFSPDGRLLAMTGLDGTLEIWDVERRRRVGGTRSVVGPNIGTEVRGFPGEDRIVMRGGELLRVWDLDSDGAIADVDTVDPGASAVARDGRVLMYWGLAGLTRMPLDPGKWADHLCRVVGRDLTEAERRALPPGGFTGQVC